MCCRARRRFRGVEEKNWDRIDLWVNSTRSSRPLLAQLGLTGKIVPVVTFHQAKLYLACHLSVPDAGCSLATFANRSPIGPP